MSAACHQNDIHGTIRIACDMDCASASSPRGEKLTINRRSLPTGYWIRVSVADVQVGAMIVHTNLGRPRETYITRYLSRQIYRR